MRGIARVRFTGGVLFLLRCVHRDTLFGTDQEVEIFLIGPSTSLQIFEGKLAADELLVRDVLEDGARNDETVHCLLRAVAQTDEGHILSFPLYDFAAKALGAVDAISEFAWVGSLLRLEPGVEFGDIAVEVNGFDLTDFSQAVQAMQELRSASEATVLVNRNGEIVEILMSLN